MMNLFRPIYNTMAADCYWFESDLWWRSTLAPAPPCLPSYVTTYTRDVDDDFGRSVQLWFVKWNITKYSYRSGTLGDFFWIRTSKSAQTGQLNALFHTFADLVNRVIARQIVDWSVPNSHLSPNDKVVFFSMRNFLNPTNENPLNITLTLTFYISFFSFRWVLGNFGKI